jgi:aryl-alcohol dehydrogenase-like predicted oxidoreductase
VVRVASTDLSVSPLCLGGNVFGWTADRDAAFAVLDAYVDAGGTHVDTSDSYSDWVDGHVGGESESLIGDWLRSRRRPADLTFASKVGQRVGHEGLSADNIRSSVIGSLQRLGVDAIDLYYAHEDDPDTPLPETLEAFDALVGEGLVRNLGASNYTADRLEDALSYQKAHSLSPYVAVQPEYNLVVRDYEHELAAVAERHQLLVFTYFSLASGFLTGKYRSDPQGGGSERAEDVEDYRDARGDGIIAALDRIAARTGADVATVALAWLLAQPTVTATIASARAPEQLPALLAAADLVLSEEDLRQLDASSAS